MRLTALKGIGEKTEELFNKLGVHNQEELLEFFPRDYELFFAPGSIGEIGYKTFGTIKGCFMEPVLERRVKKLVITSGIFKDEIGASIKVVWFNAPYLKDLIKTGQPYVLKGRISRKYNVMQMDQPRIFSPEDYAEKMGTMQPIYPLTKGLTDTLIKKAISQVLDSGLMKDINENDIVPECVADEMGLCSREFAFRNIHFPGSREDLIKASARMAFEEIFLFIMTMKMNSESLRQESSVIVRPNEQTDAFLKGLPFKLTDSQEKVINDIRTDLGSGFVMNRLIQGDVGSGKTMVALAALMDCAFAGYQGAFMAPTEVLARQHYENITGLFKEHGINLNAALLTGSQTALEKRVIYDALEDGRINIIIGTHALFQEKVKYKNLGIVITDEQHRFGLKQRQALAEKGAMPHMMVMSATPIPRTLGLIIYGDMDVSTIDHVPVNRKPIKTAVVDDSYKPNAYRFIEKEVAKGHQVYIICPMVEYSEGLEAANVVDYTDMLKDVLDESIVIGMLHGQMNTAQKNEIMEKFAAGKIDVLVSTTVVEVGVDVPNATVMMIEDANRFGLASLHQLRGRVGRGADQSYCILVSNNSSKEAMERLDILTTSTDGFEIAAKDLEMRGPGEFMGVRQSGTIAFKCFDMFRDADLAVKASEAAGRILSGEIALTQRQKEALDIKAGSKFFIL